MDRQTAKTDTSDSAAIAAAPEKNQPGYVVIRQEDMLLFDRRVSQLAAAIMALQKELDTLRKENERKTSVNHQQALQVAARIRARAAAICEKYGLDPAIHAAAFRRACRNETLTLYGVRDWHDLPARDLADALRAIDGWSSYALVRRRRDYQYGSADHGGSPGE